MNANTGWLFYKNYYDKRHLEDIDYESKSNNIKSQKLSRNAQPDYSIFTSLPPLQLFTTYPGLLIGSGYQHDYSNDDAFKIGFYFDYSTGLPVITGSSVKGVLRSIFPFHNKDLGDKFKMPRLGYVKELLKEAGINQEITDTDVKNLEKEIFEGERDGEPFSIMQRDVFLDAYPVKSYNENQKFLSDDYITPHKRPLKSPTPLKFLKVLPRVEYHFYFKLEDSKIIPELTKEKKSELFKLILLDMGIGAKTNVGYGQFTDERPEEPDNNLPGDTPTSNVRNDHNGTTKFIDNNTIVKTEFKQQVYNAKIIEEIEGYYIFSIGNNKVIKRIENIYTKFDKDAEKRKQKGKTHVFKKIGVGDKVKINMKSSDGKVFTVIAEWS